MSLFNQSVFKAVLGACAAVLLFSCTNTKITQTWVEPNHEKNYKNILVIGISNSEQNRRAYESHFVEELKSSGIEAETSYRLIKSNEKIDRNSIAKAIKGLGIDAVIVTHMVAVDEDTVYRPGVGYTVVGHGGYSGYGRGLYGYYPYVNTYVQSPGYYTTHETYTLETNLYDVKSEELVWSARSRSFSPESVDEVIVDLSRLLIKDLEGKDLIKVK